ncbi:MAG: DUF4965 domain-containing protein [Clostridiales bacterium]|jgi:hypothetical protein|nr:DUF4965 domain-containing protein [Clostridiales bacterium]
MGNLKESIIARLGSRISVNFRPRLREIRLSPIGRFFDKPVPINFGVACDGQRRTLCFGERGSDFQFIEQHELIDGVLFKCRDYTLGIECDFRFAAPFYPKDEALSLLPALYVTASVRKLRGRKADKGQKKITVFCTAEASEFFEKRGGLLLEDRFVLADDHIHHQDPDYLKTLLKENPFGLGGIRGSLFIDTVCPHKIHKKTINVDGAAGDGAPFEAAFVISGFSGDPVLKEGSAYYRFTYTRRFSDVFEVSAKAIERYTGDTAKSQRFADIFENSSLGQSYVSFLGFTLRSYFSNTWWVVSDEGGERFSVYEGNCMFHSTLDVEYNIAPFYLFCWPELLEMQLENWAAREKGGYMPHDLGVFLTLGGQAYPHNMEIEENCNFILLLYAYDSFTARKEATGKYIGLLEKLIDFGISCDLTGNGLANLGTANTIDDASSEIQLSEEQVYLGVKQYAAYLASEKLFTVFGRLGYAQKCSEQAAKIVNTIENNAWTTDHYAVTLSKKIRSVGNLYRGNFDTAEDKGGQAYSIYTGNGLLFPMLCGEMPAFDLGRLKTDIISSEKKCRTRFGGTHSSTDKANVWISQNIWRDLCAAYFGVDMLSNLDSYRDFEGFENSDGRGGCFIDTYGWNGLRYYPRGIAVLGYTAAAAGLSVNRRENTVAFKPVRAPLRVPLLALADWTEGVVPFLKAEVIGGRVFVEIVLAGGEKIIVQSGETLELDRLLCSDTVPEKKII